MYEKREGRRFLMIPRGFLRVPGSNVIPVGLIRNLLLRWSKCKRQGSQFRVQKYAFASQSDIIIVKVWICGFTVIWFDPWFILKVMKWVKIKTIVALHEFFLCSCELSKVVLSYKSAIKREKWVRIH